VITFIADKKEIGVRLDRVLLDHLPEGHSRTEIQHFILKGMVTVDGSPVKTSHRLKFGERVEIEIILEKEPEEVIPENIPLNIIYEDDRLIVVNKPSGMVTHPGAGNREHTLVNALLGHDYGIAGVGAAGRSGIVHRLDKDTSGVIIVAKDAASHRELSAQFKNRRVYKEYIALVKGVIDFDRGMIDEPIGRSVSNRKKMAVTYTGGRSAVTKYEVLERYVNYTLVKLKPETGRTHQIRVHLANLGYPIIGDKIYGRAERFRRLALHAHKLGVFHPLTKEYMEFEVELPVDFQQMIDERK